MLHHLVNHFNETTTTNGAVAYKSTKSDVLDLFSQGGAMRHKSDEEVVRLFSKAFAENATLALKTLFYLRDIKQGQGERRFFKLALQHLALHHRESLVKNLHLIPQFGRWDDMWELLDTDVRNEVATLVKIQLRGDKHSEQPSLLAKWMPSANASSETTIRHAKIFINLFGTTPKKYRKLLTALRAKISLVETKMTEGRYEDISYDKLPSKAGMNYRKAFHRNDGERYRAFLDSLSKGEVKVNSGTLYPNDIVGKILRADGWQGISKQDIQLFEGQWNNLTDFIGDNKENSIVMADVSGSMGMYDGKAMEVSIALAMYIAERNEGIYHNHFMTFTDKPSMVAIKGSNIVEKVKNIQTRVGYSTNIQLALQTVLDVAVQNQLTNDEMLKKIYIISDMQFDSHEINGTSVHIFNEMKRKFDEQGFAFPDIVFWNVRSHGNQPVEQNAQGVQLVSGYSPSILTSLLNADGKTPYDYMIDVIVSERYAEVIA